MAAHITSRFRKRWWLSMAALAAGVVGWNFAPPIADRAMPPTNTMPVGYVDGKPVSSDGLKILVDTLAEKKLNLKLVEKPLGECLEKIASELRQTILLDTEELLRLGVSPEEPITIELDNHQAGSALRLMLRPLGLTYDLREDVIMVTALDATEATAVTKVYPIGDLVDGWNTDEIMVMRAIKTSLPREDRLRHDDHRAQPVGLTTSTNPASPRMSIFGYNVVLRGSMRHHEQAIELLSELRNNRPGLRGPSPIPQPAGPSAVTSIDSPAPAPPVQAASMPSLRMASLPRSVEKLIRPEATRPLAGAKPLGSLSFTQIKQPDVAPESPRASAPRIPARPVREIAPEVDPGQGMLPAKRSMRLTTSMPWLLKNSSSEAVIEVVGPKATETDRKETPPELNPAPVAPQTRPSDREAPASSASIRLSLPEPVSVSVRKTATANLASPYVDADGFLRIASLDHVPALGVNLFETK